MDAQFLLAAAAFGTVATVAVLTALGVLPRSTAVVDAWSAMRPTVPRRWLTASFLATLTLPVIACGILVGTAGKTLPAGWSDAAQFLLWLALGIDAVVTRRRLLVVVAAVFLAFSAYAVATHV